MRDNGVTYPCPPTPACVLSTHAFRYHHIALPSSSPKLSSTTLAILPLFPSLSYLPQVAFFTDSLPNRNVPPSADEAPDDSLPPTDLSCS